MPRTLAERFEQQVDRTDRALNKGTKAMPRTLAERFEQQVDRTDRALNKLVIATAPQLLAEHGIGAVTAAQILVSWSHTVRCRDEGAFARLAGVAPVTANSGQSQDRHRLNRGGDRQLEFDGLIWPRGAGLFWPHLEG